jgi:two-component system chemotaxis sensor kinase CheA
MTEIDEIDEIIEDFLVESFESLDRLDEDFVLLEQDPTSKELLGSIFRTVHTIKGTSSFLDFTELERLAHAGENLLSLVREGALLLDTAMATTLLEMVDALRATLDTIQETRTDAEQDHSELVRRLEAHAQADAATDESAQDAAGSSDSETGDSDTPAHESTTPTEVADETESEDPTEDEAAEDASEAVAEANSAEDATEETAAPVEEAPAPSEPNTAAKSSGRSAADSSIRVDVDLLDHLMDLVSELVLARNQIRQYRIEGVDPAYDNATQQLDLLTSDLQQAVMATRMQPLSHLFGRLPRMVRDLATTCAKQVQLQVTGGDTELDRTLLEAIRDPLTHIVRNSVDHGIESPEDRVRDGKPEHGTIWIDARHEGGQVMIEITDDGKGFDLSRIAEKAVAAGVISAEAAPTMGEREIAQLVFHPGLSTAEKVTTVSGRGVGMDVVKRSIDEIGGTIDIETALGVGSKLTLRIPLTLAIIPALRCTCGGQRYLIPQLNVVELHKVDESAPVELIGNAPVYRLRGELLPLLHWKDVLQNGSSREDYESAGFIVVIHAHGLNFGFVVDEVVSTEEIVVKPLRAHIKGIDAFAGSTVLGDGSVALIFDPIGITASTNLSIDSNAEQAVGGVAGATSNGTSASLLVCDIGERRVGFSLSDIVRLESVEPSSIDRAAGEAVVQYRGTLMRILQPEQYLPGAYSANDGSQSLSVLVLRGGEESDPVGRAADPPIRLSIPIDGHVTDVLDGEAIRARLGPSRTLDFSEVYA